MSRVFLAIAIAIAIAVALGGCTEPNAVLELHLALPPAPDAGPRHALVQARRADEVSFAVADWLDSDELGSVALGDEPQVDHVSIETVGEDDFDLNVRVRWCESVGCSEPVDDPSMGLQTCLRLEHPFYLGHGTEYRTEPLDIAAASMGPCGEGDVIVVDRCAIRGCAGGDDSPSFCRMDGRHLCE